jgi:transposase InsO family protein
VQYAGIEIEAAFGPPKKEKTMPKEPDGPSIPEQWAHCRFSIVGQLLTAPPEWGKLGEELDRLAAQQWRHPRTQEPMQVGRSTIERWYYRAAGARVDPVGALARRVRCDRGRMRAVNPAVVETLRTQYAEHPGWTYRLHADNLAVVAGKRPELGRMPSYRTLIRTMQSHGLVKRRRQGPAGSPGAERAERRLEQREVRSYDSQYTNALWHLDYHHGSVRVLLANGKWAYPVLLGILDDHSRLCCHAQWYLDENAENLIHALTQAMEKRGMPRALMSDNGSPMVAAETTQGLERLGIVHDKILPYSPYQNGKQEHFWSRVEGRLLAMLESVSDLTLAQLNEATLAWAEMEYNRCAHSELGCTPLESFVRDRDVARPAPSAQTLRAAFTQRLTRVQRRSDGTVSVFGRCFEVPSSYRHIPKIHLRAASWDLSYLLHCCPATGNVIGRLYPQDKHKNANAHRRTKTPLVAPQPGAGVARQGRSGPDAMAPLMRQLLAEYAATGLPPAYIPKDDITAVAQDTAQRKED